MLGGWLLSAWVAIGFACFGAAAGRVPFMSAKLILLLLQHFVSICADIALSLHD
jgi:hypothetical protein